MSGFADGGTRHILGSLDVEILIFPEDPRAPIQISAGDGESVHLTVDQAEELISALQNAVFHVGLRRIAARDRASK